MQELAKYVDEKFYELTGSIKSDDHFARAIASCVSVNGGYRMDLTKRVRTFLDMSV